MNRQPGGIVAGVTASGVRCQSKLVKYFSEYARLDDTDGRIRLCRKSAFGSYRSSCLDKQWARRNESSAIVASHITISDDRVTAHEFMPAPDSSSDQRHRLSSASAAKPSVCHFAAAQFIPGVIGQSVAVFVLHHPDYSGLIAGAE